MRVFKIQVGWEAGATLEGFWNELGEGAVAIRTDVVESLEELELAYHLAKRAFANKTNMAKKLRYEFLLWLAGKTDIRSAVESTAPEAGGDVFVVVFSGRVAESPGRGSAGENGLVKKLVSLGAKEAKLKKKTGPLALERISLSRLK